MPEQWSSRIPKWASDTNYTPVQEDDVEHGKVEHDESGEADVPIREELEVEYTPPNKTSRISVVLQILLVIVGVLLFANLVHPLVAIARAQDDAVTDIPSAPSIPTTLPAFSNQDAASATASDQAIDWSQYAYCQHVTNLQYLCNSVMIFESLHRLNARADRLMMYPREWSPDTDDLIGHLLRKAQTEYNVHLQPITVQTRDGEKTWADSFTKLLAFNQTQYRRVLSLDSDATVLQAMDELFLMPSAPVAMPRAYWLIGGDAPKDWLSSQVVLIEPSTFEFARIEAAFDSRGTGDFDMEIVNQLYGDSCSILPHRRYDLLTGEFKGDDHARYLGSKEAVWDADEVVKEAKFVHFSDWPLPKPWDWTPGFENGGEVASQQPKCKVGKDGKQDCREREIWLGFYSDFRKRSEEVCGEGFVITEREVGRRGLDEGLLRPRSRWEPVFS